MVQPVPEQQFLAMHYESIAKSSDRDPRQTFRSPSDMSNTSGAGVVGPMGSSSFNLPSVERALVEMEGTSGTRSSNPSRSTVRKRYVKKCVTSEERFLLGYFWASYIYTFYQWNLFNTHAFPTADVTQPCRLSEWFNADPARGATELL